ncbi:interleukin-26 [Spinachia spinachia]
MFLLFIKTWAVAALLGLVAGGTDAAQRRPTCPQEIPAGLIRDLWSRTQLLISRLPKDANVLRRLLPKFCTDCPERVIGWLDMKELMDVYQRRVFSRRVVQKLLPPHYSELLYRIQHTLQHCVSSSKSSEWLKIIKKLERKIQKRRDEGALKAVGEFIFILRWIDELTTPTRASSSSPP